MAESPRNTAQALAYAAEQAARPTQDWSNYCLKFVRSCYGIPPLYASAWAAWLGADDEDRHTGGTPSDAPVGTALCYKGGGPYGHIMLAAHPIAGELSAAWSNDLVADGEIDKVARTAPITKWGQGYLGYLTAVNGYDLMLPTPRPKQDKPYAAIEVAIERLKVARKRARSQGDRTDAQALSGEIEHLTALYEALRRF